MLIKFNDGTSTEIDDVELIKDLSNISSISGNVTIDDIYEYVDKQPQAFIAVYKKFMNESRLNRAKIHYIFSRNDLKEFTIAYYISLITLYDGSIYSLAKRDISEKFNVEVDDPILDYFDFTTYIRHNYEYCQEFYFEGKWYTVINLDELG